MVDAKPGRFSPVMKVHWFISFVLGVCVLLVLCVLLTAQASCLASDKHGMRRWTEKASEKASKKDKLEKAGLVHCLFVFLFLRFCYDLHYNS